MLAADGSSTVFSDLTDSATSFEGARPLTRGAGGGARGGGAAYGADAGPSSERGLDAAVLRLMEVVSQIRAAAASAPLSEKARADVARARFLLEALGADLASASVEGARIADDGTWFETPSGRVDVARRGAVRRILSALAERRTTMPGRALCVDELFEIGWPQENIPYESQVRRVYTAIWTLRTLGLDGLLLTRDEGYLLDPKQPVALAA